MFENIGFIQKIKTSIYKPDPNRSDDVILPPLAIRKDELITEDMRIRDLYEKGWKKKKRKKHIKEVVLHGTAGGSDAESLLRWMAGGERAKEYNKGIALFHYLIGRAGEVIEVIHPDYWTYHSSSGWHDKETIGIEIMNPSKLNDAVYTEEQYHALEKLIFDFLMPQYQMLSRITSHRYNRIVYKNNYQKHCPGTGFDWAKLDKMLVSRGLHFKIDGNLRYGIV